MKKIITTLPAMILSLVAFRAIAKPTQPTADMKQVIETLESKKLVVTCGTGTHGRSAK